MKRILCFGDSNTYGHDPVNGGRFNETERWPMVLQKLLGKEYRIIEEGLCGRTTIWDSPIDRGLRGDLYLWPCLQSHSPLDLVIIMLGTNDCKDRFSKNSLKIAQGMETLINIVKDKELFGANFKTPELLIISPVHITRDICDNTDMCNEFGKSSVELSGELSRHYEKLSKKYNLHYINAEDYTKASKLDGVHMEKEGAAKLAEELFDFIKKM